jgi:endonuclease/exonuclease/phosphatase family metal-dependent hydrolase
MKIPKSIGVGLSLFLSLFIYFTTPALAAEEVTSLKLATWNLENLRENANKDFPQLQDYAKQLDADVVALQEVDGVAAAKKVFDENEYQFFFSDSNNPQRTGFAVRQGINVTQNPDYEELNLGDLRNGTDITINVGDRAIRMLSVHLKSFCFEQPLNDTVSSRDCRKLKQQLPILEDWIDTRAQNNIPFVVMGDFNRRFNLENDDFWQEIDDATPANADLVRVTENRCSDCWNGEYPEYIDHIVFDQLTSQWWDRDSFQQLLYNQPQSQQDRLSDHCAIASSLNIPSTNQSSQTELLQRVRKAIEQLKEIESMLENN